MEPGPHRRTPCPRRRRRRAGGRDAPLTDVYFCAQLGRDGSPGRGPRTRRPRPAGDQRQGCPEPALPRAAGGTPAAPLPPLPAHVGLREAEVRLPRRAGSRPLPDPTGEARTIALPPAPPAARTWCPLTPSSHRRRGEHLVYPESHKPPRFPYVEPVVPPLWSPARPCLPAGAPDYPSEVAAPAARAGPGPGPCRRRRHPGRRGPRRLGGPGPEGAAAGGARRGPGHGPPSGLAQPRAAAIPGRRGWAGGRPGRRGARGAHGRRGRPRGAARGSGAAGRGARALRGALSRHLRRGRLGRRGAGGGAGGGTQGGGSGFPGPEPPSPRPRPMGPEERRWRGCRGPSAPIDGDVPGSRRARQRSCGKGGPPGPSWDRSHSAPTPGPALSALPTPLH